MLAVGDQGGAQPICLFLDDLQTLFVLRPDDDRDSFLDDWIRNG